jgi:hypothetical protein
MKGVSSMIHDYVQLGDAVEHRGIVVAPLFPRRDPVVDYMTLDDALSRGLRITEIDDAGTVPELVVENPLSERVLLYDGEELVGAKQNRILNVSVLVEAGSKLRIPVSCVEQGRWSRRSAAFAPGSHVSHAHLRRRKAETQAARPLARGVAQGEVWDEVRSMAMRMSVDSPTGASSDLYRSRERELRALEDAFSVQPGQCGVFFGLGNDMCVDVVSRPDAFARLWPKLRAGYLLDALDRLDGKPTPLAVVPTFLSWVDRAGHARQPSVGLGEDVRIRGERVIGSGLELAGELIQLSAFTSRDGGRREFGRIARPSNRRS